jgi:hypothetical protein
MVRVITLAAGLLAAATLVGAQTYPPQQPAQPPAQQPPVDRPQQPAVSSQMKESPITMSGCVKPGASAGIFILADATVAPSATAKAESEAAVGTAGATTAAAATSAAKKSYNLVAKPGEDLSQHLNHKVEVTGIASASLAPSAPAAGATSQPGAASQPGASTAPPAQTLNVQTVKMVSASCS